MTTRDNEITGRHALVTGASSGIGRQTALALTRAGARVSLVARRRDRLEEVAEEVRGNGRGTACVITADLSRPGEAATAARAAVDQLGAVDILVNNAGSAVGGSVWAVGDAAEARAAFEVDLWSPLALIHALVPGMRHRGGTVVNVTSIRQVVTWPMFGHSSASKAALATITEALRLESARHGVHVVDVVPGPIETPAQGPTKLIPGITEALHDRLGTATAGALANEIVTAIVERRPLVLFPATVQAVYDDPRSARAALAEQAASMFRDGTALPDELLDTLVVGADDPIIIEAMSEWERAHAS